MTRANLAAAMAMMSGAFALAACQPQKPAESPDNASMEPTGQANKRTLMCDDGSTIVAHYRDDLGPDGGLDLEIEGKTLQLYLVPSGSGSKYSTEQGLTPDMLLIYWEKDDEAMLIESPLDDSVTGDDDIIRARCNVANPGR